MRLRKLLAARFCSTEFLKVHQVYNKKMSLEDDLVRFTINYSTEKRRQFEEVQEGIVNDADPVVKFLKEDDPIQFVTRGFMLCESKVKELVSKYILDANMHNLKFTKLLDLVCEEGFLKNSEVAPYKKLRDLRNEVAHRLEYQITTKDATSIWDAFNREQRAEMQRKSGMNRVDARDKPDMLVKLMILRLYTHMSGIIESEDLRRDLQAVIRKPRR